MGRAVDGNVGGNLLAKFYNAQILHDKGIHTAAGGMTNQRRCRLHLLIGHQGVQREMYGNTANMTIFHRLCQHLGGKILGALTGVERTASQIYCIGAILDRRTQSLCRPRRR